MSVDLCEHDLPLRACEICREAADLLGKGDNVLISRAYLTEWIRDAHRYQDALKLLEVTEKENAALREELVTIRAATVEECANAVKMFDGSGYGVKRRIVKVLRALLKEKNGG